MSLKLIKTKIRGIDKTHKVTKAMEAVSAVKMRKSQERALTGRPYAVAAINILKRLGSSFDASRHPLVMRRAVERICIIVVTSDRGLAGSLNSAVLKSVNEEIARRGLPKESYTLLCLGKKGSEHFAKRGFKVAYQRHSIADDVRHADLAEISHLAAALYRDEKCDLVLMAFTNFVSTFEQKASIRVILPLEPEELERIVRDITPRRGKFAESKEHEVLGNTLYTMDAEPEAILNELFPFLVQVGVYHALLEAKASEHSARMVAMKNASDKARDLSKELTRSYNKARQALITREVSEIVGGIEAMR